MLTALKGGIARVTGNRNEDHHYDPAEEPFREYVLTSLSNSLNTLIKKGWISDESVEQMVSPIQELNKHGWDLDLRNFQDDQGSRDSRFDRDTPVNRASTLNSSAPPSLPRRSPANSSTRSRDSEITAVNKIASGPAVVSKFVGSVATPMVKVTAVTKVVAIADYDSKEDGDLAFKMGDIISKIESVDDNWYSGEFRGRKGIFPKSFVKPI
ncbi:Neutrophil cytosol factor 2 [Nowakowskiella sp. JEL0078]|nr:Neutrophil cytosol factor 2 [Nowakowskiella sp. JEL0078]